ncbi:MAG: DNA primase [Chloroflexota bacterium]|nr:DNA primase [Chloroflexota bacterium]
MSVVDEIKDRLDIVEVISSYAPLKKSGRNYKALCPFHSEKTPSFVVFPESQNWHCFGACAEGGDIFSFVMKQEGWDFRTALEELARRAGVELRPRTPAQVKAEEESDRLRELLMTAARYYNHLLRHASEAETARDYVARRSLDDETVERFLLGYSLPGWNRSRDYLTEKGYTIKELVKAGLLVRKEETGSTYDRFRERLMIPIRDAKGRVIGFGARTLDPEGAPKYLNSPQTELFNKSHTLFGLDLARKRIRREDQVVIVEGYMDVMQAQQAGFTNVVAQMGTALTEAQLRQLQRYTKRLVLALDPDAAGVQATLRGVEVAREALEQEWEPIFDPRGLVGYEGRLGAEIRVLRLPPDQDPDDLIREDPQRWNTLVAEAVPVVDFYLQILMAGLDLNDTKSKAGVVDTLLPVLQAVTNPVEREDYAQKIARALRIDARAVLSRLRGDTRQRARSQRAATHTQKRTPGGIVKADLESHCLAALLQRPGLLSQISAMLEENQQEPLHGQDFREIENRTIFETWEAVLADKRAAPADKRAAPADERSVPSEALRAQLPSGLRARLEELLAPEENELADEQQMRDIVLTLLRLRERNLKRLGQELSFLTLEAKEAGDIRAEQYIEALRTYKKTLLRTQQALAQRWV